MKKKQNLLTTAFVIMLLSFSLNSCKKTETEPEKETADSLLAAGTIDPNAITRFSAATSYNQEARNLQFYNRVYKENAVIPQAPSGEFWENYTQYYPGCSTTPYHRGLDTRASEGTPIYSPLNGVVILADDASGNNWGQVAVYDSDKDVTFTVVHLSSSVVKVGISTPTVVLHGQLLGYSGKKVKVGTVQVTPHLHSEFRRGRKTSCPPCPGTTAALIEERNRDTYDPRLVVDLYPTLEILSNINQSAISSSIFTNNSNIESGNRLVMNCAHRYNHITGILRVELSDANGFFASTANSNIILASKTFNNFSATTKQNFDFVLPNNLISSDNYKMRIAFRPSNGVPPVFSTLDNISIFSSVSIRKVNSQTLSVAGLRGSSYQWFRNGVAIVNASNATYTSTSLLLGTFKCRITRNGVTKEVSMVI